MMKVFYAFLIKEFRHILRDRRTLLILFGLPIMQIIIFGFALTNEVKNSQFAVIDPSQDDATKAIINELDASPYFSLYRCLENDQDIEKLFRENNVRLIVNFSKNFQQDLIQNKKAQIQLIADASDTNTGMTVVTYASQIINSYQQKLLGQFQLPQQIKLEVRFIYNPLLKSAYNFVPGLMAMIVMLLSAMLTSIAIVREKENGNMEVLLVSPLKPLIVVITKAIPFLLLSFLNVIVILLLSYFLLDVPCRGSVFLFLGIALIYIFTSLAIGLLISTRAQSQQVAMFISLVGLMLPTIIFSGFMFPVENMPLPLFIISHIFPSRWFYTIAQGIMIQGLSFDAIWKETLILFGIGMFFLLLSIKRFKIRLDE